MNSKILFVAIAIVAAFGTGVGLATLTPVVAQDNMTMMMDENMTGMDNMTAGDNMTMMMDENMTAGG